MFRCSSLRDERYLETRDWDPEPSWRRRLCRWTRLLGRSQTGRSVHRASGLPGPHSLSGCLTRWRRESRNRTSPAGEPDTPSEPVFVTDPNLKTEAVMYPATFHWSWGRICTTTKSPFSALLRATMPSRNISLVSSCRHEITWLIFCQERTGAR